MTYISLKHTDYFYKFHPRLLNIIQHEQLLYLQQDKMSLWFVDSDKIHVEVYGNEICVIFINFVFNINVLHICTVYLDIYCSCESVSLLNGKCVKLSLHSWSPINGGLQMMTWQEIIFIFSRESTSKGKWWTNQQ